MLYTYPSLYIYKDGYSRILSSSSIEEAIHNIPSDLASLIVEKTGDKPTLTSLLKAVDDIHLEILERLPQRYGVETLAQDLKGILEVYGTIIALISYEKGLKPESLLPGFDLSVIEEYLATGYLSKRLNPYTEHLVKFFREKKKLEPGDVVRIYDHIRSSLIDKLSYYSERIVAGLLYDLISLRLCTVERLSGEIWRPILIDQRSFTEVCKLLSLDFNSAMDILRKTRPCMAIVVSMTQDLRVFIPDDRALDLVISIAPSYFSPSLVARDTSVFLREYVLALRQQSLLRLALVTVSLGDSGLKNSLRVFIERWVKP